MSVRACPYTLWDEQTVFEGKWLKTRQIRFKTEHGNEGIWQSSHRTTKPSTSPVDGVDIIALLKTNQKKFFVFVKQFRIPMGGWCLEFPAGLIDENETVEAAALRELQEETGYVATPNDVIHRSCGLQGLDPGLTDDSIQFVTVEIDGEKEENRNPVQKLAEEENIEVVLVETSKILEYLRSIEKEIHIEAMVYSFALGVTFSNQFL